MEQRVKERLTGATILVAVVVLLVPELFRGERAGVAGARTTEPGAPLMQSYTIDLGSNAPASNESEAVATPAAMTPSTTATPSAPSLVPPAPLPPATDNSEEPAKIPGATPSRNPPAAVAAPSKPRVASAGGTATRGWAVQVGSFGKRDNAERMVRQAGGKGIKLIIAGPDDRGLLRVRTAVQATRADAARLQTELQERGLRGIVAAVP